jgi:hypothetical protein
MTSKLTHLCALLAVLLIAACGSTDTAAHAAGAHPRLLLDAPTLTDLRARVKQNTPAWQALRKVCDSFHKVNRPNQEAYPDNGTIGAGYQGDGYFGPLFALGVCYQSTKGVDSARSKRYGRLGAQLVSKMATTGRGAAKPKTDDGYGVRHYGEGLAIGYDWFHDRLSHRTRKRIGTVVKHWVSVYEHAGFGHDYPQGNYFAGYYGTVGLASLGMDGKDRPMSFSSFLSKVHEPMRAYAEKNLSGGGWPEGWNYGPVATMNMDFPVLAAKTARGVDLTKNYRWPVATGKFLTQFTWPGRDTLENSGAVYNSSNPTQAPAWLYLLQSGVLASAGDSYAPYLRNYARSVRAASGDASAYGDAWPAWIDFVYDRDQPEADIKTTSTSYLAAGSDMGAVRSSWDTDAVWGAFTGGPYVNNPDNGEEYFDKGALTIVNGSRPFLVNTGAELQRDSPGTSDGEEYGDKVYSDLFDDDGARSIFNVFYTDSPTPLGQGETTRKQGAKTRMGAFEDAAGSVYMRADDLQDMYPRTGDKTIGNWTREVVYLRPDVFVVHDRTAVTDPSVKQWMAFHLSGAPATVSGAEKTVDVSSRGGYAGRAQSLLPANATVSSSNVFDSGKVYRLEVDGPAAKNNEWLTVFDAAPSADKAAVATLVSAGPLTGAAVGRQVALFANGPVTAPVTYTVPGGPTQQVIVGLAPGATFKVDVQGDQVTLTPGGDKTVSAAGVLRV